MEISLYFAALLAVAVGVAHSYLGEKYILIRLFRRENLPKTLGSVEFTMQILRFAWHLTTMAWWGFAGILILLAQPSIRPSAVGAIIGATFLVHFVIALLGSRGRHLSWIIFLAIGVIAIYATRT